MADDDNKVKSTGPNSDEHGFMWHFLHGGARKAAQDTINSQKKMDKAVNDLDDEPPKPQPAADTQSQGKYAGELGKKWKDTFHF